ncbi:MAG: ABC transporter permease [Candidatus Poribacteria bacterium]|nr:ABC transporter permease [Candidatus Poribacteria bacterium]
MKFRDAIIAGVQPLTQNRLRAGLSILGIFIGVAGVLCMVAIGDGAKRILVEDIEKLGGANQFTFYTRTSIFKRGRLRRTTERYTLEDAYAIEAECPEVLYVLPNHESFENFVSSRTGNQALALIEAATADYARGMNWKLQTGRFLTENDIETAAQVCVLGADIAIELFGEVSPVGQEVKVRYYRYWRQKPVRMRVVGVMKPKGRSLTWEYCLDDAVCVPLTTYQQRLTGIRYVEYMIVFFQKDANVNSVIACGKSILRKRHRGQDNFITYYIPKLTFRRLDHIQKVIKITLGSIAGFSLFVSGIGIMNICLVSVGEKTREIGLRKSVGAKRIHIFYQFLTESICLCLCGGLLGIVGGWGAAHALSRLAVRIVLVVDAWPVVLSLRWILISVTFSIVMGVGFGVYPAIRAAQLSPIDALRSEN